MGLIDILTQYDAKKKAAHAAKTVKHGVSCGGEVWIPLQGLWLPRHPWFARSCPGLRPGQAVRGPGGLQVAASIWPWSEGRRGWGTSADCGWGSGVRAGWGGGWACLGVLTLPPAQAGAEISTVHPEQYAKRFLDFITNIFA